MADLAALLRLALEEALPDLEQSPLGHGWNGVVQIHVNHQRARAEVVWSVGKAVPRVVSEADAA